MRTKEENAIKAAKYAKTKKGIYSHIYAGQKTGSKKRGHVLPLYTKDELIHWLNKQELFHVLFRAWELTDYNTYYKPSVDRLDSTKPYSFDNIHLTSWGENERLAKIEQNKRGLLSGLYQPVVQLLDGCIIGYYESISEAERRCGVSNVSRSCQRRGFSGEFNWCFVEDLHE